MAGHGAVRLGLAWRGKASCTKTGPGEVRRDTIRRGQARQGLPTKNLEEKMKIEYKAKSGSPFPKDKAQEIGIELEKIQKKHNGVIQPDIVVESARSPKSKLHPYFDWKDTKAADKWRKHQARQLINHIEISYINNEKEHHPAFINIKNTADEDEEPIQGYVDHITVGTKEHFRQQALSDALRQLIHWKEKYKWLNELGLFIEEIDKLEKAYKK
jgi:hypothetical protein